MTFDELMSIFYDALYKRPSRPDDVGAVKAVVTALRDEYADERYKLTRGMSWSQFDKILASDGVEATAEDCSVVQYTGGMNDLSVSPVKAAGASARKDEGADGGSVILSDAAERIATPAAAPDVCVWTGVSGTQLLARKCSNFRVEKVVAGTFCNNCGKPIKFTEAAR